MRKALKPGLYVITDGDNPDTGELIEKSRRIVAAGVTALQYRDKHSEYPLRLKRATALQSICKKHGTLFIINDDIQLAKTLGADGVHIGRDDPDYYACRALLGDNAVIGVSCYNDLNAALDAEREGADYIAFGAFFATSSKQQTTPAPIALLTGAREKITIPIVAIGGITPENGGKLLSAGADILAVISGVYGASDPELAVKQYNQLFR